MSGFETPAPDEQTAVRLRALQNGGPAALDRNPIDVTLAGLQPDLLRGAVQSLLDSPTYDGVVVIVGSSALAMPELMAGVLRDCLPTSDKPVLAFVSPHAPEVARLLNRSRVPAYTAPESCATALGAMLQRSQWKEGLAPAASADVAQVDDLPAGSLDEAQAKRLFARFGIAPTRELEVSTVEQAERAARALNGRLVLKILSAEITHKSDVGGVAVNLLPEQVGARLNAMAAEVAHRTGTAPTRFLVQEMVQGGTELILGVRRDPLGTALLVGMGGVAAELFKDTAMRLLPSAGGVSHEEAASMLRELKTWPLLDGYRGRPRADMDALISAIVAFSKMAAQLGSRLVEAEINPLFVLSEGEGVRAADGVVVLDPTLE
jgi:acyl-CoA synthetase (NDP forming)